MKNKKVAKVHSRACRICKSPFRGEIEFLIAQKASYSDLAKKYHEAFGVKEATMYNKITRHVTKNHPAAIDTTPVKMPTEEEAIELSKPKDFHTYAQKLLGVGFDEKMLTPGKVTHNNIIAAQRALIMEEKVKGTLDNQRLLMMKFFRGNSLEGEVIDDRPKLARGEDIKADTD